MARSLRIEFEGAIYHVSCRMLGDAGSLLFRDDADRERFLKRLAEKVEEYSIRLYMFVLMSNHFHLVFETPKGNCSNFMQSLLTAYTVYYNLRHNRHGHLLDGRYGAKLVEGDEYLLALIRYEHLNPVKIAQGCADKGKDKIASGISLEHIQKLYRQEQIAVCCIWADSGGTRRQAERTAEKVSRVCGIGIGGR